MKIQHKILVFSQAEAMSDEIEKLSSDDWTLHGDLMFKDTYLGWQYIQAMTKEDY